jgi:protein tyrosine phosphatase
VNDSYINANYINTSTSQNDQFFIATQGPLQQTIENFWRMIWQERVHLIVMLTCVKESGKVKCD